MGKWLQKEDCEGNGLGQNDLAGEEGQKGGWQPGTPLSQFGEGVRLATGTLPVVYKKKRCQPPAGSTLKNFKMQPTMGNR